MVKKALCVGINDYPYDGSDLNGCINDALGWADLLINHFGFAEPDVKLMFDAEATKANIMAALTSLIEGAKSGDIVVFTNASHGTYIADTSGDEPKYDEAICPYDCATDLIVDDELRPLFGRLKKGARLVVISDSCFSGTVTRVPVGENVPGLKLPDDRRVRFLNPGLMGRAILENPWKAKPKWKERYPEAQMVEMLLSGCTDKEYSNDALIDGAYHGAMSYFAQKTIREMNYQVTYQQLQSQLLYLLDDAGYPQHPQLEGKKANKKRPVFT